MSNQPDKNAEPLSDNKREISSIQFPYNDLDEAITFAKAIHNVGGQSCQVEQAAGYLKVQSNTGPFKARISYTRIFGLIEYERGTLSLTPLGLRIVDASQEESAKVEAFLNVPLYKAIYDKYRSYQLPPTSALENEMVNLGVSAKQKDKARQVFDRSAKQAGFFWAGSDRLTLPVTKGKVQTRPLDAENGQQNKNNQNGSANNQHHPFIEGLLKTLPNGKDWPIRERAKWLRLAANAFDLIYEGDGEIDIQAKSAGD